MLGQIFIGEGVVTVKEFQDTAVFAQYVGEDHLRLALHQAAERADLCVRFPRQSVVAEYGPGLDREVLDVADLEPLAREVFHEGLRTRISEHSLDLGQKLFPQFTPCGEPRQLVVRHGGPEKVRQP